ncbi:uncharacterized protein LOC106082987 [Stomoxys calcitrans]|uniref:Transmembrane protein 126A n=1 Tax=Stomoxys calcitrans TaxID=35570 RepID=A0A1I8PHQ1_STOCA|nr:uncharacterized protein LOC106082987 [Stomoxys calcitrans]
MALSRASKEFIPKDAVVITEEEALTYQWNIISNWEKLSDVWSLRYGPGILAAFATGTGVFVNNHYRNKLRLGSYGRFSTYLPIVVIPAIFTLSCHKFFVQRPILLEPMAQCPTCVQMRAMTFQAGFGVVYPTILAPFAACMFATRHYTYRLPSITQNPMEVFQLIRKFTKPIIPILSAIFCVQGLAAIYLTYEEQKENLIVLAKMRKIEQEAEERLGL